MFETKKTLIVVYKDELLVKCRLCDGNVGLYMRLPWCNG